MEEVIKVSNLTRKYKDFSLGPVDLSFPKGFATALIGANGAGKTTLMDIICGITAKTDGTVTYFEKPIMPTRVMSRSASATVHRRQCSRLTGR